MGFAKDGTLDFRKNNRLSVFKRKDNRSAFWYGRMFIKGQGQMQVSSGERDKKKAVRVLDDWFERNRIKDDEGQILRAKTMGQVIDAFEKHNKLDTKTEQTTKEFYQDKINIIKKCKSFLQLKSTSLVEDDVARTYLMWRNESAKKQKKVLRGKTLEGDLRTITKILNWSIKQGYRKKSISNLSTTLLTKKLRNQSGGRIALSIKEYKHLIKVSNQRIKSARGTRDSFNRARLHQFIIFMMNTGLRVEESLSLTWSDITFCDKEKDNLSKELKYADNYISQLDRYYLKINVAKSKVGKVRQCTSLGGGYFALEKLMDIYKDTGIATGLNHSVWGVKSFREGLNSLLNDAGLKKKKIGDEYKSVDAKSFRHSFIQSMMDKNIDIGSIANQCGTSIQVIQSNYSQQKQIGSFLEQVSRSNRSQIKLVN